MFHEKIAASDEILPPWRLEYDRQVMKLLEPFRVDICLLAGYMLIVGQEMCEKYDMINLHPALPNGPKGTWQEVIWQLISNYATESGVMIHLVTPQLDRGPVVTFCRYPITGNAFNKLWDEIKGYELEKIKIEQGENNELFKRIRREGFIRETPLIIETLKALSYGDIKISNKSIFDRTGKQIKGFDVTDRIDKLISKCKYIE
jgi:folate-dependent phosphoribosylglycinamide formyltransferase PurN